MFNKSKKPLAKLETIVGPGTEMEGNLHTRESVRLDGKLRGEIRAESVVIGEQGVILGDIHAVHITIAGKIKGNIVASESLDVLAKAQIIGDIKTNLLTIAEGAVFEGQCRMARAEGQIVDFTATHFVENKTPDLQIVSGGSEG